MRISPSQAKYHARGVTTENREVYEEVLTKLAKYPTDKTSLCIDMDAVPKEIVPDSECGDS